MNSKRSKLYLMFSVCIVFLAVNSVFGETLSTHFLYTANTGNNAIIGIPTSINPTIDGVAIAVGDEIGVFTAGGLCVGAEVWTGSNIAITVWGDNDQTTVIDGIKAGEQMQFRIWRQLTNAEYSAQVTYTQGTSTYASNDNDILGSLIGTGVPLTVELTSFSASVNRLNADLKWATATEKNNYGFEIERRSVEIVNSTWAKVGFVQGAGTSNIKHEYTYSDNGVTAGRYAYRIKQVDNDCSFKYSQSTEVEIGLAPKELTLCSNYPNPFNPTTNIEFTVAKDEKAVLKVYNAVGQEVAELYNGEAQAGRIIQTHFNASGLASGMYFSRLEADGKSLVKRMMFVK